MDKPNTLDPIASDPRRASDPNPSAPVSAAIDLPENDAADSPSTDSDLLSPVSAAVSGQPVSSLRMPRPTSEGGGPGEDDTAKTGLSVTIGTEPEDSSSVSSAPMLKMPRPTSGGGGPGEDDTAKTGLSVVFDDEPDGSA